MKHKVKRIALSALFVLAIMEAAAPTVANAQAEYLELVFEQTVMAPGDTIAFEVIYMTHFDTSNGDCLGVDPPDIPLTLVSEALFGPSGVELTGYLDAACSGMEHTILTGNYRVPLETAPGEYAVYVMVRGEPLASQSVRIEVRLSELTVITTAGRSSGLPGTEVTVSGGVFKPGEEVGIIQSEPYQDLASTTADSDGSISVEVQIPGDAESGEYTTLTAIGMEGGGGARGKFFVAKEIFLSLRDDMPLGGLLGGLELTHKLVTGTLGQRGELSFRNDYDPVITVSLHNWWGSLSDEEEKELHKRNAGLVLDLGVTIRDSSGNEFHRELRSVNMSKADGGNLYDHPPSSYSENKDYPLMLACKLSELLEEIPCDWWDPCVGSYKDFLALRRASVNAPRLSSLVESSAPLSEAVTVKIEVVRAEICFDPEPGLLGLGLAALGASYPPVPVNVGETHPSLEYKLGQAVTVDELVDITTWKSLTQPTLKQWIDLVLIIFPTEISAPYHFFWCNDLAKVFWDFWHPVIQFAAATEWREILIDYPGSTAYKSNVSARDFVKGAGYTYIDPFWLNYQTGNVVIIDKYGIIYPVVPGSTTFVVPYFYIVSADSPFEVAGEAVNPSREGIGESRPEGRKWEGPTQDSYWLLKRDGKDRAQLRTGDGWVYVESRRGGQLVLQPHSHMDLRLRKVGDLYIKSPATIMYGTVTVWNEPMIVGEWPKGTAMEVPPKVIPQPVAYFRPTGTKYTVRVEENERFEVSVEEGSVEILDRNGNLVETVTDGESKEFAFQQFRGESDANQSPSASFALMPQEPEAGDTIVVASTSSDPDGDRLTTAWYLNGEQLLERNNQSDWEWEDVEAGDYTLTLKIDDGRGGSDEYSTAVTVAEDDEDAQASSSKMLYLLLLLIPAATVVLIRRRLRKK